MTKKQKKIRKYYRYYWVDRYRYNERKSNKLGKPVFELGHFLTPVSEEFYRQHFNFYD